VNQLLNHRLGTWFTEAKSSSENRTSWILLNYGTANDIKDISCRIESMTDTGVTLASHQYLGASGCTG